MERLWGRGWRGLGGLRSLELMMNGASVLIASTSAASGVVTWVGLGLGLGLGRVRVRVRASGHVT